MSILFPHPFVPVTDCCTFVQAPVKHKLSKNGNVQLHFVNGQIEAPAAIGVAEQYEGPYYRFFDKEAPHVKQSLGVAESSSGRAASPEDWGRLMREYGMTDIGCSRPCDSLQQYIEQHDGDPFDGVLGFSEGASLAASLILHQSAEQRTSPFKFAIFICGIPPCRWDREGIMLADETVERITIPTAHIAGSKDPLYQGSRVLYNLCDEPSASISDHHGAPTIPWDLVSTQGITKEIRVAVQRFQSVSLA